MTQVRFRSAKGDTAQQCVLRTWVLLLAFLCCLPVHAASPLRKPFEDRVTIGVEDGRFLGLQCKLPRRSARAAFLKGYLAEEMATAPYEKSRKAFLPYAGLKPEVQRRVIETLFPQDYADETGWWHVTTLAQIPGLESWWNIAEWFTGRGANYEHLEYIPDNQNFRGAQQNGKVVFIPRDLLKEVFKTPSPSARGKFALERLPVPPAGPLRYGRDRDGEFGVYTIKSGEELHAAVMARFTAVPEGAAARAALLRVFKRSGIAGPEAIRGGQKIRIPLDMIAIPFRPASGGTELEGVVVILDPGHGGTDPGKESGDVFEDEITYDIVLRIREELERDTRARVHVTVLDPDHGGMPTTASSFEHDEDEVVLTTPNYNPTSTAASVIMRMFLVNDLYRQELARGTRPGDVLFASIHVDSLPARLSGTMVYIPGANYREDVETFDNPFYQDFKEAQGQQTVTITRLERQQAEAISRDFAQTLLDSLQQHDPPIAISSTGQPIRERVIKSPTSSYIPGVIRNSQVPTRVLVETANVENADDRGQLIDSQWRQAYAEAFANAVRDYYNR